MFSMEVQGNNAKVTFESMVDAILIAAVYNEEGTQMLTFGRTEVSAQQKEAVLEIDSAGGLKIPKYFYLRGMLLEKETLHPFCNFHLQLQILYFAWQPDDSALTPVQQHRWQDVS